MQFNFKNQLLDTVYHPFYPENKKQGVLAYGLQAEGDENRSKGVSLQLDFLQSSVKAAFPYAGICPHTYWASSQLMDKIGPLETNPYANILTRVLQMWLDCKSDLQKNSEEDKEKSHFGRAAANVSVLLESECFPGDNPCLTKQSRQSQSKFCRVSVLLKLAVCIVCFLHRNFFEDICHFVRFDFLKLSCLVVKFIKSAHPAAIGLSLF